MPKTKRPRRTIAEIRSILCDLEKSGQSQLQFSSKRNIPLSTLQSWIRKRGSDAVPCLPDVIPVGTLRGPVPGIEIELPGGKILRFGPGCRGEDLRTILSELRRC